jgi:hypothetical protein
VLSVILTAAVLYPNISDAAILWTLAGGALLALFVAGSALLLRGVGKRSPAADEADTEMERVSWRMPPLSRLEPARLTMAKRIWLGILRFYLVGASIMVIVRVTQIALGQG